jgi:hypothetical protein
MLTSNNKETAKAFANECGLLSNGLDELILDGDEFLAKIKGSSE